jgi:hypothetical protein
MILISSILHPSKEYVFPTFFNWCKNQTYQDSEYFFQVHKNPERGQWHEVRQLRENSRLKALELNAEAVFFIDSDTIPQLDTIERMRAVKADMVSGLVHPRNSRGFYVANKEGDRYQDFVYKEDVSELDGGGLACCLVWRRVLEEVDFLRDDEDGTDGSGELIERARGKGFRFVSLNTILCDHHIEPGRVLKATRGYVIRCADSISINGKKFTGRISVDHPLFNAVFDLDTPYREDGIVKTYGGGLFCPFR